MTELQHEKPYLQGRYDTRLRLTVNSQLYLIYTMNMLKYAVIRSVKVGAKKFSYWIMFISKGIIIE